MDLLRKDDIETARRTPESECARRALETMQLGIDMKRAKLRDADRVASDDVIDARLWAWLAEPR